jgi:hypothetical protein
MLNRPIRDDDTIVTTILDCAPDRVHGIWSFRPSTKLMVTNPDILRLSKVEHPR